MVEPVTTADCGHSEISTDAPIVSDLNKSGGFSDDDPDAAFLRDFLMAPDVRLPAGTWDISAIAQYAESSDCSGGMRGMRATVRVEVVP